MRRLYGRKTVDRHGPCHYGGPILGAFRYIGAVPRKCKAFKCRVAVRSAVAGSRFINNSTRLYEGWDTHF